MATPDTPIAAADDVCEEQQVTTAKPRHRRTHHFVARGLFDNLRDFAELEARISDLPTQQDRGYAFEVFAEAYLATQALVGAEEIWTSDQVPIAVLETCRLPLRDLGADGVYKTSGGQYNAYQSKFRTGRPALAWQELSTFMGLTDQVGERVLFTNCDDLPAVMDARSGFFCIRGNDLDRLTDEDLGAITDWLRGEAFTPSRKGPRPHQREAVDAILAALEKRDRVTAVMACGTGKTLVSLWSAERKDAKRILVLVPSLALIRQTLHEWLKETAWERPRFIAVCSDPTIVQGADDPLIVYQKDLDFPVTTDVGELRNFLDAQSDGVQIVFSTYHSARVVGEAARGRGGFDVAFFDEAHKTAGREGAKFGFALEDGNVQITKRVFLTATPRHYDVRKKDKEGDKALVYSMDNPAIYGPIVHTLSFAEAAKRGIICNYKVIISVVTSDMINADLLSRGEVLVEGDVVRARSVANQIAIQNACEAHNLKKIFSFHRSVASARNFAADSSSSIKTHLPGYVADYVSGEMPTAKRERRMRAFREVDRAIMANARCLTEGVDVPAVDLVAFLSPRKSKVDIVQAAGRAMRKADDKKTGYVLLPLFLETQDNETVEEALERTDFEEAWDVLHAMQEQDAALADIIRQMREERGRLGGFDDSRLRERVDVLGPEVSLEALRSAISTALVDRLGSSWDERIGELKLYKERFGHCNVPQSWKENFQLGTWVSNQRSLQSRGQLSADRKKRLDALGFGWDPRDASWEAMFAELKRYGDEHGHCNVPRGENPELGKWVGVQRALNKTGKLSAARKKRLDEIGFVWNALESAWETMFAELKRYKDKHGHCDVLYNWKDNPELGRWVRKQRQRAKAGRISEEPKARLDEIGFTWEFYDTAWERRLAELMLFRKKFGHCNVPSGCQEFPQLRGWVMEQRTLQNEGNQPRERKERLDAVGFIWNLREAVWAQMFAALKDYKDKHGHCDVPAVWAENRQLGRWVTVQRVRKKRGTISDEEVAWLDALGFNWVLKRGPRRHSIK